MNRKQKDELNEEISKITVAIQHLIKQTEIIEKFGTIVTKSRRMLRGQLTKPIIDTICKETFLSALSMDTMIWIVGKSPKVYEEGGK